MQNLKAVLQISACIIWTGPAGLPKKSSTKSHKDDFGYLEFEGGANFSWGEMYGFFDWENFYNGRHNKPGSEQRYTFKNTNRIYLGDTGFNLYLHAYMAPTVSANRGEFSTTIMFLYGIGYNFTGSGWWFKPFFASVIQIKPITLATTAMSPAGCRLQLYAGQREIHSYQLERVRV
ncbi:nucleoside-specific channel-forming protein Tsx [Escherichia coli]|nr:nucleoside-specific channel-forming protein Tsx [Escherichia coli]